MINEKNFKIFNIILIILIILNIILIYIIEIEFKKLQFLSVIGFSEEDLIRSLGKPNSIITKKGEKLTRSNYSGKSYSVKDYEMPINKKVYVYYGGLEGTYYVFIDDNNKVEKMLRLDSDSDIVWFKKKW